MAVELLEEVSRGEALALAQSWSWLYQWPVPWSAIALTLTALARQTESSQLVHRAWTQIELCFVRHNGTDSGISMRGIPAWRAIEVLCDQAVYSHCDRLHDGAAYMVRVSDRDGVGSTELSPDGGTATGPDSIRGVDDVRMIESLLSEDRGFAIQSIFGGLADASSMPQTTIPDDFVLTDWGVATDGS